MWMTFAAALSLSILGLQNDVWPDMGNIIVADHELHIPNLPPDSKAFNPSIIALDDKYYLAFRCDRYDLGGGPHMQIGIARLDDKLEVDQGPSFFPLTQEGVPFSTSEDPRLVTWRGELYVTFNSQVDNPFFGRRGLNIAHVQRPEQNSPDDPPFVIEGYSKLLFRVGGEPRWTEKNWAPFVYDDAIHMVYTTNPPHIVRIEPNALLARQQEIEVQTVSQSDKSVPFSWGEMRGGSQATLSPYFKDDYAAFFHTRDHRDYGGGFLMHLAIGFYTFAPEPPFEITRYLPIPLHIEDMHDVTGWGVEVAYPGGYIWHDNQYVVAYGYMDRAVHLLRINPEALKQRLFDVGTVKEESVSAAQ